MEGGASMVSRWLVVVIVCTYHHCCGVALEEEFKDISNKAHVAIVYRYVLYTPRNTSTKDLQHGHLLHMDVVAIIIQLELVYLNVLNLVWNHTMRA